MASIVDLYRNVLYGDPSNAVPGAPAFAFLIRTAVTAILVFLVGWWVFRRVSPRFGEEV
jgi:ABC-type polysaccharide/polyol phosphate export permease